jgi:hypothetical protein
MCLQIGAVDVSYNNQRICLNPNYTKQIPPLSDQQVPDLPPIAIKQTIVFLRLSFEARNGVIQSS